MDDNISRQSVLDAITASINQYGGRYTTEQLNMWGLFAQMIKEMPSARPEPKKGKWIEYEQEFMLEEPLKTVQKTVRECSVCTAKIAGMVGIMNYCPNCGAKMEVTT